MNPETFLSLGTFQYTRPINPALIVCSKDNEQHLTALPNPCPRLSPWGGSRGSWVAFYLPTTHIRLDWPSLLLLCPYPTTALPSPGRQ